MRGAIVLVLSLECFEEREVFRRERASAEHRIHLPSCPQIRAVTAERDRYRAEVDRLRQEVAPLPREPEPQPGYRPGIATKHKPPHLTLNM